jgi:hypothetical protein
MERALYGVEVPVYHFGEIVGTRRVYNDSLLMFLLRNRAAKRFSADSWSNSDAATRGQLERLKKQWRAEWEEEHKAKACADSEEIIQGIDRKLARMRQNRIAAMSPETRDLHDAFMASHQADNERGYHPDAAPQDADDAPPAPPALAGPQLRRL